MSAMCGWLQYVTHSSDKRRQDVIHNEEQDQETKPEDQVLVMSLYFSPYSKHDDILCELWVRFLVRSLTWTEPAFSMDLFLRLFDMVYHSLMKI